MDSNIIKSYNDLLYNSRPVAFSEFINDKLNKVHNELYIDALNKFFDDIIKTNINSKFVFEFYKAMENRSDEFDKVYDAILRMDENTQIKKALSVLTFDDEAFFSDMFDITCKALDNAKEKIVNDDLNGIQTIADISDFRIIYINDSIYLGSEDPDEEFMHEYAAFKIEKNSETDEYVYIEEHIFESELRDYVFILEKYKGTRIGYNNKGEWVMIFEGEASDIEDLVKKLNDVNYIKAVSINLIKLYRNLALSYYKKSHKIIEIKKSEYWMPSSINIISNVRPFKKQVFDLTPYWNMIQSFNDVNIYDVKLTNENILDAELCELNYITGMAKIQSRSTGLEYEVPFRYLNEDVEVSQEMTLNDGFITKYNDL